MPEKPVMTTVGGRPALVVPTLHSLDGVYVQCRLPSGEDAFVPLREIAALFENEMLTSWENYFKRKA